MSSLILKIRDPTPFSLSTINYALYNKIKGAYNGYIDRTQVQYISFAPDHKSGQKMLLIYSLLGLTAEWGCLMPYSKKLHKIFEYYTRYDKKGILVYSICIFCYSVQYI